jgi:para-aminobenzoate synthetase
LGSERSTLPVLGICLGFQSLCKHFGGKVQRLTGPQHGIIRKITHNGDVEYWSDGSIYNGVGEIRATLYQSLCMQLGHKDEDMNNYENEKWTCNAICPDLRPLAWAEWDGQENDSGMMEKRFLVAVQHRTKPFWGLQYHPESICTNEESIAVIKNWYDQAIAWNESERRSQMVDCSYEERTGRPAVQLGLLSQWNLAEEKWIMSKRKTLDHKAPGTPLERLLKRGLNHVYRCHTQKLPAHISVADILEVVQGSKQDQILLESSNSHEINAGVKERYSIIGMDVADCVRLECVTGEDLLHVYQSNATSKHGEGVFDIDLRRHGGVWPFLAKYVHDRSITNGHPDSPFWGGFMGYTTYEMGLEGIGVAKHQPPATGRDAVHSHPDLSFAWVTRSLVLDHEKGLIYIQDISAGNAEDRLPQWIMDTGMKLAALLDPVLRHNLPNLTLPKQRQSEGSSSASSFQERESVDSPVLPSGARSSMDSMDSDCGNMSHASSVLSSKSPSNWAYETKVSVCQAFISAGDSYELCLTDETTIIRPRLDSYYIDSPGSSANTDSWSLYRTVRTRQPAPFASYIRLGAATLISASPERFLSWTASGKCELRPMKGTVRKSAVVSTLEQAKALLDVPKEKAENLMIVDLVRHDLYSVCGSGNVAVPRLMVVEEYKSVFQMSSIVQGQINRSWGYEHTGIDVLAASLPPGSMTGAPKKRSCEILRGIEQRERGMYSGVVGYMDVGGRGDFAVTIRCMFRWDEERSKNGDMDVEKWHIAAGGAVTTLSTPAGEREEMRTKMSSTLSIFE